MDNENNATPLNTFEGITILAKVGGEYGTTVLQVTEPNRVRAVLATLIALDTSEYLDSQAQAETDQAVTNLEKLRAAVTKFGESRKGAPTA